MRNTLKDGDQYLNAYVSGSGFVHFVWSDINGKASGRKVTVEEAKQYLGTLNGLSYTQKGWRIVKVSLCPEPVLAAPITRKDHETLLVHDKEYKYIITPFTSDKFVQDFELELTWNGHKVLHDLTIKSVLAFLNHEKELTEQPEGL